MLLVVLLVCTQESHDKAAFMYLDLMILDDYCPTSFVAGLDLVPFCSTRVH
jgi:hypothetical protein